MSLSPPQTATESSLNPLERHLVEVESSDTDFEEDFNPNVSRFAACLSYILREIKKLAISHPLAVGPRFQKFLRETELEVIHHTILNAVVDEIQEILGCSSGNAWKLNDLKYGEETWHTMDHGCYLAIAEDPAAVLPAAFYVGCAYGVTSSLYHRVSQHLKANHRMRNPGNLLYSYIDGRIDVPRDVFVVALARFPADMFEDSARRQTYIELTETIFMALLGTIASAGSSTYETAAWQRLYPTRFPPKSIGCNRKSSVEVWRGHVDEDVTVTEVPKTPGVRWSICKKRRISQSSQVNGTSFRYRIQIGSLSLSFASNEIEVYGITAGDSVCTLLEIQPDLLPHTHAWADTEELPYEYKEKANSLAIQLSGTAKKQHESVEIGETFGVWLKYDSSVWEPSVKVKAEGYKRVNTAMTIIEWMLGEVIVPRPSNRLNITNAPAFANPYHPKRAMVSMKGWTEEEKQERRRIMARDSMRRKAAERLAAKQAAEMEGTDEPERAETAVKQLDEEEQSQAALKQKEEAERSERYKSNAAKKRDPEKSQENSKKNHAKNGSKWKERRRQHYQENKERIKEKSRSWRLNNLDWVESYKERKSELEKVRKQKAREKKRVGEEVNGMEDEELEDEELEDEEMSGGVDDMETE